MTPATAPGFYVVRPDGRNQLEAEILYIFCKGVAGNFEFGESRNDGLMYSRPVNFNTEERVFRFAFDQKGAFRMVVKATCARPSQNPL